MREKMIICFLLGMSILVSSGMRPNENSDYIFWSEDRDLTWDDFQGAPDFNYSDIGALTSSGIMQYKSCEDGMIEFKIQAYFEKNHSWVKKEAYTDHHLRHEQIHFNITELYARKLNEALKMHAFTCEQEQAFDDYVNKFLLHWESEQINYDLYTHYSMKPDKQKEWQHLIDIELTLYEPCVGVEKPK